MYFSLASKSITISISLQITMNPSSTAQAGAPVGAAVSVDSPEPLHPREWAMLQTSLTGAQRDALLVVVSAYTGF